MIELVFMEGFYDVFSIPFDCILSSIDVNVENKKGSSKKKAYERGYTADRILGATDASGELMFLFKWQETDEVNLIPASIANLKWPQIVIQFYEARLSFHSS